MIDQQAFENARQLAAAASPGATAPCASPGLAPKAPSAARAAVWAFVAATAMFAHIRMMSWIYGGDSPAFSIQIRLLYLFYLLCAALGWICVVYLDPLLERHYPSRLAPRIAFGLTLMFSGIVFITIAVYLHLFPYLMGREVRLAGMYDVFSRAAAVALLVYGWLQTRRFGQTERARALALRFETDTLATDLDRSELAMLEAQIEPHFLFNTLAHVKRLYRMDTAAADHVLGTLIDYLDRALPALRSPGWTIADELDLIALYLELLVQRFGERLQFRINLVPACGAVALPALTIATLVENAVRHGLAPKAGAGMVEIEVRPDGAGISIDVRDDGVGLRQSSGNGLGLATVRARLRSRFGAGATLAVAPQAQGGVCASIRLAVGGRDAA
ncbi:MAG: histidine kinase [Pseudomonadota bacterium]